MKNTYSTGEIAKIIGIHPNTVRMYEDQGLITTPARKKNGYRVFTDLHIDQFHLARTALEIEVLQNGLRKQIIAIIKASARQEFDTAIDLTHFYINCVDKEITQANEAVRLASLLMQSPPPEDEVTLKRQEVSELLDISLDCLRNWEMNGLLTIKRKANGYRVYTAKDIRRLKLIRTLRCGNYSLSAILRMLNTCTQNTDIPMDQVLNTPNPDEDIISVCDKLIHSLWAAKKNALAMLQHLEKMKTKY